jgi:hypothetical protein
MFDVPRSMFREPRTMFHEARLVFHVSRFASGALVLVVCCSMLAACQFPGSVKPTVKIGLSAPFEGRYRDLGYEVLYSVRLAVRQRNDAGGLDERYLVEFVALNDFNESEEAVLQARKMDVDPGVLGVLGGWAPETAGAAAAEYERLGLAFLYPSSDLSPQELTSTDSDFEAAYKELSGGVSPGPAAFWAYAEANRLLDALDVAAQIEGWPTRAGVQAALAR